MRESDYDEKEIIRIISARKANKEEQAQYFCYQSKKKAEIDYSDIPELDFKRLGEPLIGRFYKPTKNK